MFSRNPAPVMEIAAILLLYLICSNGIPFVFIFTRAQQTPLFSVTVLAPGGPNIARRQYASTIVNNMIAIGIDAKLVYTGEFNEFSRRVFFANSTQGATFAEGGYDMGFVGWGLGSPTLEGIVPDFTSNFDGRPSQLAPNGYNWYLYDNPDLNKLLDLLSSSTDTQTQVNLVHKWQEIVFNDAPSNFIFEPTVIVARNLKWTAWGSKDIFSPATFPDIQHWSGGSQLTIAIASPWDNLNPACTSKSSSSAALSVYMPIMYSGAGLQEVDARDLSMHTGLATSIGSSPDGLHWTVKVRPGSLFQSGVEITADDFVWTRWALLNGKTGYILRTTDITNLGNVVEFTFLNGTTVALDSRNSPNEPARHGWWKAIDRYTFEFYLTQGYAFTRQNYAAFAPLPKHIMEKFSPKTWNAQPFSTAQGPYTYTWDTGKYGGSGSYRAVGPVGAGPYYMESYDSTNNTVVLRKFPQYWNATGLEALGQFTVETYRMKLISDRSAAFSALKDGEVDYLHGYNLAGTDKPALEAMGVNVISAPDLGYQELGFNLRHPIFGTGVDTPLGKSNSSRAADAARHVRKAISHLIPREQIVKELTAGSGYPLASFLGPGWGAWYNSKLKPDSYDPNAAADELRAAGYSVAPISGFTLTTTSSEVVNPNVLSPQGGIPYWLIGVIAVVAIASPILVFMRKRKPAAQRTVMEGPTKQSISGKAAQELKAPAETGPFKEGVAISQRSISTGYEDLDGTLEGGILEGYAVVLVSPSFDERDLVLRKIIESSLSSGRPVFYVTNDIAKTQDLISRYRTGLYAFCSQADRIQPQSANAYKIPGIENLSDANLSLGIAIKEARGKLSASKMVIVIDILSDVLLRHRALTTRRWLTDFVSKRKAEGFTILATLNPLISSKEETQTVIDFFDGIIEIYEKELIERLRRFLIVKKMYGRRYSQTEILLDIDKLWK